MNDNEEQQRTDYTNNINNNINNNNINNNYNFSVVSTLCHSPSRPNPNPSPVLQPKQPKQVRFRSNLIQFPLKQLYAVITTATKSLRSILKVYPHNCALKSTMTKIPTAKHQRGALDSGATATYLPDDFMGTDHQVVTNGMIVACANDATMQATSTDKLDLPLLPAPARECHKFREITVPLVSVGKLCDNDLYVTFSSTDVVVTNEKPVITGNIVMTGQRISPNGLYYVPLATDVDDDKVSTNQVCNVFNVQSVSPPRVLEQKCNASPITPIVIAVPPPRVVEQQYNDPVFTPTVIKSLVCTVSSIPLPKCPAITPTPRMIIPPICTVPSVAPKVIESTITTSGYAASAYEVQTVSALINFYHMSLCSPNINEWIECINKNWFRSFPGLTAARVRKHCTKKQQTTLGNQKMISKNVRTSKPILDAGIIKKQRYLRKQLHSIGTFILDSQGDVLENLIAMDLAGRYPITSARGHKYIMVMYDFDSNYINAVPIKSRKSSELVGAFKECYDDLKRRGFEAQVLRLDNEISAELIAAIEAEGLSYQIVSPNDHRLNHAERHIQYFKSRFIACREGTDPTFPTDCWDLFVSQIVLTMNLMRPSRINPLISAYTQIHGEFDYNKTPIAPVGCKVLVHDRTNERASWDNHGSPGFYIDRAPQHYRNYTCYMQKTKQNRISNTVEFFPTHCDIPKVTPMDRLTLILQDLHEAITTPSSSFPFLQQGTELHLALDTLQKILCLDLDPSAITAPVTSPSLTVLTPKLDVPTAKRTTRSTTPAGRLHPTGTIVRRRFTTGIYHEGEIIRYDPIEKFYKIRYQDGDTDDMTYDEITNYKKKNQRYERRALLLLPLPSHRQQQPPVQGLPTAKSTPPTTPKPTTKSTPIYRRRTTYNACSSGLNNAVTHIEHNWNSNFAFAAGGAIWDDELNKFAKYRDLVNHHNDVIKQRWLRSAENEFARLFQGYNGVEGIDVLEWILRKNIPKDKQVTYPRYVVDIRPEKSEMYRTRITAGGDRIDYFGEVATHTASMETIKMHWNSVLSTPGARYCTADISNMYLCSDLPESEYVRFKYDMIPPNIIKHYNLDTLVENGFVYAKINKAWYGLKQSGRIAHDDLVSHLKESGYVKAPRTEGLFVHKTRKISFTLVVDDFGIKYEKLADLEHLTAAIRKKYPLKVDYDAKQYVGITLDWNYDEGELICSMPGYVAQALREFEHASPPSHYKGPSKIDRPDYGVKVQYVKEDLTKQLTAEQIKFLQRVTGKFLFYARAIDNTMLHAINDIASATMHGTEQTLAAATFFLNYAASNPDGEIIFRTSDMILRIDSDAAYLVCPKARSRAGGYHYLGSKDGTLFNGPILVLAKIIKNVMASAAEAEVAGIYMNAQLAVGYRNCLIEMGHPQPPTPIRTDNTTARGIITGTIKQKRSKAIDMRFYWLNDRYEQGQFDYVWGKGTENLGDAPTKHHPGSHHLQIRPIYLHIKGKSPKTMQGCVELLTR